MSEMKQETNLEQLFKNLPKLAMALSVAHLILIIDNKQWRIRTAKELGKYFSTFPFNFLDNVKQTSNITPSMSVPVQMNFIYSLFEVV